MTVLQDQLNALIATLASIKKVKADKTSGLTSVLTTYINQFNAFQKSLTSGASQTELIKALNAMVSTLIPYVSQFDQLTTLTDSLMKQSAGILASTAPIAPMPVLNLSASTITDAAIVGDTIGTLSVTNGTGSYTYTFTSNPGTLFSISGSLLKVAASLTAGSDSITIKADNGAGSVITKAFLITVNSATLQGWQPIRFGAGGFVLNQLMSADGTLRLASTDSGNAWKKTSGNWTALVTTSSMSSSYLSPAAAQFTGGSYAVAFAPSNLQRLYLAYGSSVQTGTPVGGLFKSDDQGASWTLTGLDMTASPYTAYNFNSNNGFTKWANNKLTVDPANANVVYLGPDPIFGNTFALGGDSGHITAITVGANATISTAAPHGKSAGDKVIFTKGNLVSVSIASSSIVIPTGITPGVEYFVCTAGLTTTAFRISTTGAGGTAVTTSGSAYSGPAYVQTAVAAGLVSTDGGVTWNAIPNIPKTGLIPVSILFDPSSSVIGGKTQGVYAFSRDNGLYHSTDGGGSFSPVSGSPTHIHHCDIASDGTFYMTDPDLVALKKLSSGTWSDITPGTLPEAVCVSPFDVNTVICMKNGGPVYFSRNKGATWTLASGVTPGDQVLHASATDIPWLGITNGEFMSVGNVIMDTQVADRLHFAEGLGTWTSNPAGGVPTQAWVSDSADIEEMIGHQIVALPNGNVIGMFSDRPAFTLTNPNVYPSTYGPQPSDRPIGYGSSVACAVASNTSFVVCMDNWGTGGSHGGQDSSYSTDSGVTWTRFPASPISASTNPNGCLAVTNAATPSSATILYVPANKGDVYRSTNCGTSWTRIPASTWGHGMQDADGSLETGWTRAYFLNSQIIAADKVTNNTVYIWNYQTTLLGGGIWKTTDGGATWTRVNTTMNNGGAFGNNVTLYAVDGKAGHLFFTAGLNDSSSLKYSQDGGPTFVDAGGGLTSTLAVCTGAIKQGNDYPSVYVVGYVNSVYSVWRSDNSLAEWTANTISWTNMTGWTDGGQVTGIDADKNIWNKPFVITINTGGYYYAP